MNRDCLYGCRYGCLRGFTIHNQHVGRGGPGALLRCVNNRNSPSKRKSILSSLVVLTGNDDFRKEMNKDISKYNDEIDKQQKTKSQTGSVVAIFFFAIR